MTRRAVAILAIAFLCDCTGGDSSSSSSSGASCPNDLPAACPSPPPSYAKDVAPVFQQSCTTCHSPTGRQANRLLTDYAHVNAQVGAVLSQIHGCRMPPADGPPLTAEGRKILQTWLVCGAPNN